MNALIHTVIFPAVSSDIPANSMLIYKSLRMIKNDHVSKRILRLFSYPLPFYRCRGPLLFYYRCYSDDCIRYVLTVNGSLDVPYTLFERKPLSYRTVWSICSGTNLHVVLFMSHDFARRLFRICSQKFVCLFFSLIWQFTSLPDARNSWSGTWSNHISSSGACPVSAASRIAVS